MEIADSEAGAERPACRERRAGSFPLTEQVTRLVKMSAVVFASADNNSPVSAGTLTVGCQICGGLMVLLGFEPVMTALLEPQ